MSSSSRRRDPATGLGRTQKLVLHLLAGRSRSVADLEYDWPSLTGPGARAAIERLGRRGLVDPIGWDSVSSRRLYGLTERGVLIEAELISDGASRQCSSCRGICLWAEDAWVCQSCGDEWYPQHSPDFAAPGD